MAAPFAAYFFLRFLPCLTGVAFVWAVGWLAVPGALLLLAPFFLFQHWQKDVAESWGALGTEYGWRRLAAVAAAGAWVLPLVAWVFEKGWGG